MKPQSVYSKHLSFRVSEKTYNRVKEVLKSRGIDISDFLREATDEKLDREEVVSVRDGPPEHLRD